MKNLYENRCRYTQVCLEKWPGGDPENFIKGVFGGVFGSLYRRGGGELGFGGLFVFRSFSFSRQPRGCRYYRLPVKQAARSTSTTRSGTMRRWKPRSLFRRGSLSCTTSRAAGGSPCLYSQVVKVKETKRLCILMMPKKPGGFSG